MTARKPNSRPAKAVFGLCAVLLLILVPGIVLMPAFFCTSPANAAELYVAAPPNNPSWTLPDPTENRNWSKKSPQATPIPKEIDRLYIEAATKYGIPINLLRAVGREETNHRGITATSHKGARGLMQFMPSTWKEAGIRANGDGKPPDILNPADSIHSAAKKLADDGARSLDTLEKAIGKYNNPDWYEQDLYWYAREYKKIYPADSSPPHSASLPADANTPATPAPPTQPSTQPAGPARAPEPHGCPNATPAVAAPVQPGQPANPGPASPTTPPGPAPAKDPRAEITGGVSLPMPRSASVKQHYTKPHHDYPGADLPAPIGTPIYTITDGKVIKAGFASGWGDHNVRVRANNGWSFNYGHNSAHYVEVGDRVTAGQKIAAAGNEGKSTGPHLDIKIYSPAGVSHCPQRLLTAIWDRGPIPPLSSLPTSGCSY